jgi:signal transduction histidine kinase
LTAHTDDVTLERAKTSDPYGYLTKPFEEHELRIAIEIGLHKHSMEQTLRRQATQLEQILQAVPTGILLLDENLHVVRSNFAGKDCLRILADVTPDGPLLKLGNYAISDLISNSTSTFWHEISTGDRHNDRVFEVSARPVVVDYMTRDASTNQGWLVVTREVTEHRNIQRHVQQQERLAAIGQLAAGIAHDFNNLIASINMAVEAVQLTEPNLSEKTGKRLSLILDESRRATQMIRQIMDFGKQKTSTDKHAVKLKTLLRELRLILDHTLPENILIEINVEQDAATIDANPTQLTQALLNLCLNSRDAMPNGGGIRFDVSTTSFDTPAAAPHPDMQPGRWVVVQVRDTGLGISPDVLPHIFEPFFTTKAPAQGTGLGLAQVYGIVQQH